MRPQLCTTCNQATENCSQKCTLCSEVENRLDEYLKSAGGRMNAHVAIMAAEHHAELSYTKLDMSLIGRQTLNHINHGTSATECINKLAKEYGCEGLQHASMAIFVGGMYRTFSPDHHNPDGVF